jgi:hypothetical protein
VLWMVYGAVGEGKIRRREDIWAYENRNKDRCNDGYDGV